MNRRVNIESSCLSEQSMFLKTHNKGTTQWSIVRPLGNSVTDHTHSQSSFHHRSITCTANMCTKSGMPTFTVSRHNVKKLSAFMGQIFNVNWGQIRLVVSHENDVMLANSLTNYDKNQKRNSSSLITDNYQQQHSKNMSHQDRRLKTNANKCCSQRFLRRPSM